MRVPPQQEERQLCSPVGRARPWRSTARKSGPVMIAAASIQAVSAATTGGGVPRKSSMTYGALWIPVNC